MPLADNIAAYIEGKPLRPWIPQSTHLNLISAGNKYAVAVKGSWFGWQHAALWTWKDYIDRKFMAKFGTDLNFEDMINNSMDNSASNSTAGLIPEVAALAAASKMRCGGCGAKVGASTLSRVLQKLQSDENITKNTTGKAKGVCLDTNNAVSEVSNNNSELIVGLSSPDDAAVLAAPPPGHVTIHSVDFFRAIINDPFTFGAITANHALSDCYAMGATPSAALAIAVVPFASQNIVERDLYQLMAGAKRVLNEAECDLVGGHSCEGIDLALGFSVYGTGRPEYLLTKAGLRPGQALVLTKPLGTGVILAAAMRGMAQGRWVAGAVESMLESNAGAMEVLRAHCATACTDITGFGLLGHVAEMSRASGVCVEVDASAVPALTGALECFKAGAVSSLQVENAKVSALVDNAEEAVNIPTWPLLIDPQTSGGLLGAVPAERAEECVAELRSRGCRAAAVVGRVVDLTAPGEENLIQIVA